MARRYSLSMSNQDVVIDGRTVKARVSKVENTGHGATHPLTGEFYPRGQSATGYVKVNNTRYFVRRVREFTNAAWSPWYPTVNLGARERLPPFPQYAPGVLEAAKRILFERLRAADSWQTSTALAEGLDAPMGLFGWDDAKTWHVHVVGPLTEQQRAAYYVRRQNQDGTFQLAVGMREARALALRVLRAGARAGYVAQNQDHWSWE